MTIWHNFPESRMARHLRPRFDPLWRAGLGDWDVERVPARPLMSVLGSDSACTDTTAGESESGGVVGDLLDEPAIGIGGEANDDRAPTGEGGYGDVLKNPNFLALWSGQVFSQLADKVFLVLVVALIAAHFQAGATSISRWVSAVMVAFTVPAVLFGSVAGVYVDRWSQKWVMVITNMARGLCVLGVPILLAISANWPTVRGIPLSFIGILAITFAVSTLTQFFAPAEQAAIPSIVKPTNLLAANSLYTTTMMASVIVGFAIGEPLLQLANHLSDYLSLGPELGSELAVGGGYLVAGALLLVMKGTRSCDSQHDSSHVWADLRQGLDYLAGARRVRGAIAQLVCLFSIFAALAVLAVRQAELIPTLKASQFGFLLAAAGIGMGLGALTIGQWGDRLSRSAWNWLGLLNLTGSLLVLSVVSHQLWPSFVTIGWLGFAGATIGVPMQTLIQTDTPAELRGKVFGLQNNLINISLSLPLALASLAETRFGLSAVLMGLAAIAMLTGILTGKLVNGAIQDPA